MYVFVINSNSVTSLHYKKALDHSWKDENNTEDMEILEV